MRNLKVLVIVQTRHETLEYDEVYTAATNYIIEIPIEQQRLIPNMNELFNTCNNVLGYACVIHSTSDSIIKQQCSQFKQRWERLAHTNANSKEVQWVKQIGVNKLVEILAETLCNNERQLVMLLCKIYNWKIVTKTPCIIDKVVSVVIDNTT